MASLSHGWSRLAREVETLERHTGSKAEWLYAAYIDQLQYVKEGDVPEHCLEDLQLLHRYFDSVLPARRIEESEGEHFVERVCWMEQEVQAALAELEQRPPLPPEEALRLSKERSRRTLDRLREVTGG
jgi:hypothetical protein